MSTQAKWLNEWWGVTDNRVRSLESFDTSCGVKLNVDDEAQTCKIAGYELEVISVNFIISVVTGGKPRAEFEELKSKIGKYAPFYLGGKRWGPQYFKLLKVSTNEIVMNNSGDWLKISVVAEFMEYDLPNSNGKTGSGKDAEKKTVSETKILYDNVDIWDKITVKSLYYDSYAESQADCLKIEFNDTARLWDKWTPENEKMIRVVEGRLDTGLMYIHSVKPNNGVMTLTALSIPPTAKNETSKSWEQVRFLQLAEEIAKRHGLQFEAHGVTDRIYTYVRQASTPDFEFLEERAKLEGCAFLVYNKKLVLYSEKAREAATGTKTITLRDNSHYVYSNNSAKKIKTARVVNSEYTGVYTTAATDSSKELTQKVNMKITDQAEADRFARSFLRARNKTGSTGEFRTSLQDDIAAGSVINIKAVGIESWSGAAFVYHTRHDLVKNTSKIWIRRPLND